MSDVYFPQDHTAEEWLAMSRGSAQAKEDSFERSDTDGFMSQWASGVMSNLYHVLSRLAERGGLAEFSWPFLEKDGEWVRAESFKWVQSQYGSSVLVNPGTDGSFFWNPSEARKGATRLRKDEAKGVRWGTVETEAVAMLKGSSALSVSAFSEPKHGAEVRVVESLNEDRYFDREN